MVWFGNNRKEIHVHAETGSGGVGAHVKMQLLNIFTISIEDDSEKGILWLKFVEKVSLNIYYVCVVYLPPEFSARSVNSYSFFEMLMEQIYTKPQRK